MITRKQYMENSCHSVAATADERSKAHREYYAQFVNDAIFQRVYVGIGLDALMASKDPHFNDIPLAKWDRLVNGLPVAQKMREAGDYLTLGNGVCILKEAARQIKEKCQFKI